MPISVSNLLNGKIFPRFDYTANVKRVAEKRAAAENIDIEEASKQVRIEWKQSANDGSNFHDIVETEAKNSELRKKIQLSIKVEIEKEKELNVEECKPTKEVVATHTAYRRELEEKLKDIPVPKIVPEMVDTQEVMVEKSIFDSKRKVAGRFDRVNVNSIVDGKKHVTIIDWKTVAKPDGIYYGYNKFGYDIFSKYPDSKYSRFCAQLNIYKYILEKNNDMVVDRMCVYLAPQDILKHSNNRRVQIIEVPLMPEVETLFDDDDVWERIVNKK